MTAEPLTQHFNSAATRLVPSWLASTAVHLVALCLVAIPGSWQPAAERSTLVTFQFELVPENSPILWDNDREQDAATVAPTHITTPPLVATTSPVTSEELSVNLLPVQIPAVTVRNHCQAEASDPPQVVNEYNRVQAANAVLKFLFDCEDLKGTCEFYGKGNREIVLVGDWPDHQFSVLTDYKVHRKATRAFRHFAHGAVLGIQLGEFDIAPSTEIDFFDAPVKLHIFDAGSGGAIGGCSVGLCVRKRQNGWSVELLDWLDP
jgi:hypothetical protein